MKAHAHKHSAGNFHRVVNDSVLRRHLLKMHDVVLIHPSLGTEAREEMERKHRFDHSPTEDKRRTEDLERTLLARFVSGDPTP